VKSEKNEALVAEAKERIFKGESEGHHFEAVLLDQINNVCNPEITYGTDMIIGSFLLMKRVVQESGNVPLLKVMGIMEPALAMLKEQEKKLEELNSEAK
jgi:hypothetical protein